MNPAAESRGETVVKGIIGEVNICGVLAEGSINRLGSKDILGGGR